ncbi:hypothetical protein Tco_1561424 [Tanacetum coccineum]
MAASVISISLDLLVESVGSSFPRVILIGSIFVEVSIAPGVEAAAIASPAGMLKLDTHSSSEADLSESSLPPVSVAPMVSPFLCSDDSELDTEMPERHVSPTPHDAMLLVKGAEALTARKSVRPLPSHHLALRHTSHHLDRCTSESFIFGSFIIWAFHFRTPRYREDYFCWWSAPLSTMYSSMTSESSVGDSSSKSSAGPSRKRCRFPAATMTSSIHALRALVPSRADLLPPCKRFKDSILPKDSVEEDINTDVLADIEADAMVVEVVTDMDVEAGVDASIGMEVDVGVDVEDEVEDEVESSDRGTMEVRMDAVVGIDIPNSMLRPNVVEHFGAG